MSMQAPDAGARSTGSRVREDGTAADVSAVTRGGPAAVQLPDGFAPYAWAATVAEVAARHGLAPAEVLKFDQNTPALPGVAQVPLAESFATLNAYPDGTYRDLREAAAAYVSRDGGPEVAWDQIVVGAGADDLILLCARTYLAPGRTASIVPPTYALYRIATLLAGADPILGAAGATHVLPTGGLARSSGGLGLEMFMKPLQIVRATPAGAAAAARVIGPIARAEGLPLHAAAAERLLVPEPEPA